MNLPTPFCRLSRYAALCIALLASFSPVSHASERSDAAQPKIDELEQALIEVRENSSEARQRLALRRVIRDAEAVLDAVGDRPTRWPILEFIFRARQQLIRYDKDPEHRQALLETCRRLALAPVEFADLRLEADLLLSQAEQARKNAGPEERAEALRPFVDRYIDTPAGARALRLTITMALELGDSRLINDLREMVTGRFSTNPEMVSFLRDHLGGQVFGVPFAGNFKRSDGKTALYPMDGLGHSMMVIFWSKEDLKAVQYLVDLAAAIQLYEDEIDGRLEFISVNLDDLPDAGESIIRSLGLDWQVLHLPGGRNHPVYKTYIRSDPFNLQVAPTSRILISMEGTTRKGKTTPLIAGTEEPLPQNFTFTPAELTPSPEYRELTKSFRRILSRKWGNIEYSSYLSAILMADFFIFDPEERLDPSQPPELKAVAMGKEFQSLERSENSVPEATLQAIQACIIAPPQRYLVSRSEVRAAYQEMADLCRKAITEHPNAPDLWIVRNRLIIALLGLWKSNFEPGYFEAAVAEAKLAIEEGKYPAGTDVIARFCLTKHALRDPNANAGEIIDAMLSAYGGESAIGPAHAAACLLSLDVADKSRFQKHRNIILREHTEYSMMWVFSSFLLDRYNDYWLFRVPFTAGWSFGNRFKFIMQRWQEEEAGRMLNADLLTMDGRPFRIPEDLDAEYTVILIAQPGPWKGRDPEDLRPPSPGSMLRNFTKFATLRDNVEIMVAMLGEEDEATIRETFRTGVQGKQWESPILRIPDGTRHPLIQRLGLVSDQAAVALVDKKGTLLMVRSGRSYTAVDDALENTIQRQEENRVYQALDRGDQEVARELIMSLAPPYDPEAVDERGRKLRKPEYPNPYLRARTRVYMAYSEWDKALVDIDVVTERLLEKATGMSQRPGELDEAEAIRNEILKRME